MVEKRRSSNSPNMAALGLGPGRGTPTALGGGMPAAAPNPASELSPGTSNLDVPGDTIVAGHSAGGPGAPRENPVALAGETTSTLEANKGAQVPGRPVPAPASLQAPLTGDTERQAKLDQLVERLVTGKMKPQEVAKGPKTHHITITLPASAHQALESLAGGRQAPSLIRDSMLRLAAEADFRFSVAFKTTLGESYKAFTRTRKVSRSLGEEGVRSVTVPLNLEEGKTLKVLAAKFGLGPIQLLEVLAYEMVQGELAASQGI